MNAALVTSLVSIPAMLSIIVTINYNSKPEQKIDPTIGILNLLLGFSISFILNGGTNLFKTFTPIQSTILILLIRKFGPDVLPWTCLISGIFLIIMVLMQVQKFIKITPNCILNGIKFATGKSSSFKKLCYPT